MIKLMQCVRRRAGLPVPEFRARFAAYRDAVAVLAEACGALKVVVSTRLEVKQNEQLAAERGTMGGFDGIVEIAWPSGPAIESFLGRPEIRDLVARLRAQQEEFMDLAASSFFLASEEIVHEAGRASQAGPRRAAAGGRG